MLSQLSRGYGSWTAGYVDPTYGEKKTHPDRDHTLPEIDHDTHVHGVTIGARSGRSTAVSYVSTKKTKDTNSDSVALPKTYTTRKGALQLYVAPFDDEDDSENDEEYDRYALRPEYRIKHTAGQELIDLSLKLGTMGRLAMSVLNFGDQEYDKEQSSISDAKNKAFLKFLHSIDEQNIQNPYIDNSLRPGGDLNTYLQELRSSSSLRNYSRSSTYVPKNREFLELQALLRDLESNSWPSSYQQDGFSDRQSSGQFTRPASRVSSRGGTPGLPSTPRSGYRVLSSKQLTASLKSTSYLGRPSSQLDEVADEHSDILSKSNLKLRSKFSTDGESTVNEEADDTLSGIHRDTEGLQVSQTSLGDQADTVHSEPSLAVSEEPNELDKDTKEKDDESQIVSKVTDNEDVNEECMTSINPDEESDDNKTNKSDTVQKNIQPDSQDVADCRTSKDDRSEQELIEDDKENTFSESHEIITVKISEKKDIEETVSSTHDEYIPAETDQENETGIDETTDVETSNYKSEEQNYNSDKGQDETAKDSIHVGDECKKENLAQILNKSLAESELDRADSEPVQIGEKSTSSITGNKNSSVKEIGRVTPVEASSIDISGEIETKSVGSLDGIGDGAIGTNIQENKTNYVPTAGTSASITDQFDAVGQSKLMQSGKTEYAVLPPVKRPASPPEKMRIPDHLKEAMDRKTMQSYETLEKDLERMTALVDESLSGPTLEAVGEGLTEEELEIAKQILQKKIDAAKQQLDGKDVRGKGQKKKSISKPQKKGKKKKVEEPKTEEELQREAIREKQALEKQRRDEEVKELQRKIAERRKLLQAQDDAAGAKAKELREQMEKLEQEAEDLQRAEDEARDILQEVRKKQREERDARRKAELERRKQDALDRREREKKELEEKKKKEMEMMEKIADAEMRRRLREEEERKMYEEERLAQERYEAELREAQRLEEEEEEKMRELERQAEEEAMQRLIEEREAADRQRRRLMEEEEVMREAERLKREQMLLEEQRLAEERQKIEDEEQRRRAREMERLMELRRAEEEAREKLQEELERRRSDALARRDYNLENKLHVDKLRHYQGITRAWTFSYFVKWPRETYEKPIGDGNQRKVKINNPAPKKVEGPAANTEVPAEPIPQ